jgi:N-acetylmuramic acid 6-phosphate etherase
MRKNQNLFSQLSSLTTEQRNRRTRRIDTLPVGEILRLINQEDRKVPLAVQKEIPYIAKAIEIVVKALRRQGRLIYVGAGTSGRLGILDATECPPTFGVTSTTVQGLIAGGRRAMFRSQEGAEDNEHKGVTDIKELKLNPNDVVCGIAASIRTPYVIGALREAKRIGTKVVLVTTNPRSKLMEPQFSVLRKIIDVAICPEVGPEVIMGSTRMKSGSAQKLVLNMITTAAMICSGKVYENMMIDLKMNSRKLEERAKRVLMIATGINYKQAARKLKQANGHVKTAIVMIKAKVSLKEARDRLRKTDGFVRYAILMNGISNKKK